METLAVELVAEGGASPENKLVRLIFGAFNDEKRLVSAFASDNPGHYRNPVARSFGANFLAERQMRLDYKTRLGLALIFAVNLLC